MELDLLGNCAIIIAENTKIHPISSFPEKTSFKISHPESAAKTDSKLKINEAKTGSVYFCPTIWRVYATPHDIIPEYNIGVYAARIFLSSGFSKITAGINAIIPQTKNCMHDILTPSTIGEKWSITSICIENTKADKILK